MRIRRSNRDGPPLPRRAPGRVRIPRLRALLALSTGPAAVVAAGWTMLRAVPDRGTVAAVMAAVAVIAVLTVAGWVVLRLSWPLRPSLRRLSGGLWTVGVMVCFLVWVGVYAAPSDDEGMPSDEEVLGLKEEAWADNAMVVIGDFDTVLQTMESAAEPTQKAPVVSRFRLTPPSVPAGVSSRTRVLEESMTDLKARLVAASELFPDSPAVQELEAMRLTLSALVSDLRGLGPPGSDGTQEDA